MFDPLLIRFLDSPGLWLLTGLAIFSISIFLLIEIAHRQPPAVSRAEMARVLCNGFMSGLRSGIRGYFAPLRASPWLAAWHAFRQPTTCWWSPLMAWAEEIERIAYARTQVSEQKAERDDPLRSEM